MTLNSGGLFPMSANDYVIPLKLLPLCNQHKSPFIEMHFDTRAGLRGLHSDVGRVAIGSKLL